MNLSLKTLPGLLAAGLAKVGKYSGLLFFLFLAVIYAFVLYRIQTLSATEPTQEVVTAKATAPHIDPKLVNQLQQLKDNSVPVQTLFEQARNNPFNE